MKKSKKLNTKFNYKKTLTYSIAGLATAVSGVYGVAISSKNVEAIPQSSFVMIVNPSLGQKNKSNTFEVQVNKGNTTPYNVTCDADNAEGIVKNGFYEDNQTDNITCDYGTSKSKEHKIVITGQGENPVNFDGSKDVDKIVSIESWGTSDKDNAVKIGNAFGMFRGAVNLESVNAKDKPLFKDQSSTRYMFENNTKLKGGESFKNWDTSKVTDMAAMFSGAKEFNAPIGDWDTSNVKQMQLMFTDASKFNSNINNWDTSNVTDMRYMFTRATSFDQPLGKWDVSKVENMTSMFAYTPFNQDISKWTTSSLTNTTGMFIRANKFNSPINDWDMSNVTNARSMFSKATSFNQDLSKWDTSKIVSMEYMFNDAKSFNQSLADWDISGLKASSKDLGNTESNIVSAATHMLDNSGLSRDNYDATLIGWSKQKVDSNITLGAEGLTYCKAKDARQSLKDDKGWTFGGDSYDCSKPTTELANKETKKEEVPKKESKKSKLADTGSNLIAYASGLVASVSGLAVLAIRKLKK